MLAKFSEIFTAFKNPINALINRNEKKIDRLINNNIPKLEKQIQAHHTTIDKLNKSAEHYMIKKNACNHLSEVIKSFVVSSKKERNQNYLTALLSLNGDIQQINNDRIKNCIDTIAKLETNFSELPLIKQQKVQERISNLIRTQNKLAERNKVLQAAQPDISAMLARLNDNNVTERIDKAEMILDKTIAQNNSISLDSAMTSAAVENSCAVSPTAAEIVQTEVNIISNVNDKDGDMIPDRLDSTFDLKTAENNESQAVKEENPVSDVQENQSENSQKMESNRSQATKENNPEPNTKEIQYDEMLNNYKYHKAYEEVISVLTANKFFENANQIPLSTIDDIGTFAHKQINFNPMDYNSALSLNNSLQELYKNVMPQIMNGNISSLDQIQTILNFMSIINDNMQYVVNANTSLITEIKTDLTDTLTRKLNNNLDTLQVAHHFSGVTRKVNNDIQQIINSNVSAIDQIQAYLKDNFASANNPQYTTELAKIQDILLSVTDKNNSIQQDVNYNSNAIKDVGKTYRILAQEIIALSEEQERIANEQADTKIYLVTENDLESLKKSEIKIKVNREHIQEDGKIPILINAKDKGKFEKIMNDLKKPNENKVVNKK